MKSILNKITAALVFFAGTALVARAAGGSPVPVTRARFLMGTVCEITASGPGADSAITAAFAEIARLDQVMSTFKEDSELSQLNREASRRPVRCSPDLWAVLIRAQDVHRLSSGAFDPTYASDRPNFSQVRLDARERTARFAAPGIRINLGGIGKGYALDAAAAVLKRRGIRSAFLNFGGQILALETPPDAPAWDAVVAGSGLHLALRDASVSTSSQSEQPGHIVDPRTRRPVDRAGSVTVVAKDATGADAWSTAIFVSGLDRAPSEFKGCAIETRDGKTVRTAGDCSPYLTTVKPKTK